MGDEMITFREATTAEREGTVRNTWLTSVLPRRQEVPPSGYFRAPRRGHRMSYRFARLAIESAVDALLGDNTTRVIVAELATVPGEILGWVAFDREHVHFVRVPSDYARKGLARELLRRAGSVDPSYTSPAGDRLVEAVSYTKGAHL